MAGSITVTEYAAMLRAAKDGGVARGLLAASAATQVDGVETMQDNINANFRRRSGFLSRSARGDVAEDSGGVSIYLRAGGGTAQVRYAATQEFGRHSSRARGYYRIPLPAAMTAAGNDRFPGPLRQAAPDKFYARRSKAGNLLLFDRETGIPWYVLKRTINIPARPFLKPALDTMPERLRHYVAKHMPPAVVGGS